MLVALQRLDPCDTGYIDWRQLLTALAAAAFPLLHEAGPDAVAAAASAAAAADADGDAPASATALAVPPLLTNRQPAAWRPAASSTMPDLSYTESNAVGMRRMYAPATVRDAGALQGVRFADGPHGGPPAMGGIAWT